MKFNELVAISINEAKIDELLVKVDVLPMYKDHVKDINSRLNNPAKYAKWLINNINTLIGYQRSWIVELLEYFEKNQSRFTEKDINKYSYTRLAHEIEQLKTTPTKSERSLKASADAPKVFENDKCTIFNILSENAAKKYGKSTKWCISAEKNNQWNNYYDNQLFNFYFTIPKNSKHGSFAFALEPSPKNTTLCYNSLDQSISADFAAKTFEIPMEIFERREMKEENIIDVMVCNSSGICSSPDNRIWTMENGYINTPENVIINHLIGVKDGKLIFKFNDVQGHFNCNNCNLTTLEGAPYSVGTSFDCSSNKLTSLEGFPSIVGGNVWCNRNKVKFTKQDITSVCDVEGDIIC